MAEELSNQLKPIFKNLIEYDADSLEYDKAKETYIQIRNTTSSDEEFLLACLKTLGLLSKETVNQAKLQSIKRSLGNALSTFSKSYDLFSNTDYHQHQFIFSTPNKVKSIYSIDSLVKVKRLQNLSTGLKVLSQNCFTPKTTGDDFQALDTSLNSSDGNTEDSKFGAINMMANKLCAMYHQMDYKKDVMIMRWRMMRLEKKNQSLLLPSRGFVEIQTIVSRLQKKNQIIVFKKLLKLSKIKSGKYLSIFGKVFEKQKLLTFTQLKFQKNQYEKKNKVMNAEHSEKAKRLVKICKKMLSSKLSDAFNQFTSSRENSQSFKNALEILHRLAEKTKLKFLLQIKLHAEAKIKLTKLVLPFCLAEVVKKYALKEKMKLFHSLQKNTSSTSIQLNRILEICNKKMNDNIKAGFYNIKYDIANSKITAIKANLKIKGHVLVGVCRRFGCRSKEDLKFGFTRWRVRSKDNLLKDCLFKIMGESTKSPYAGFLKLLRNGEKKKNSSDGWQDEKFQFAERDNKV